MPPKWALGYQQCRWSYDSDARVREVHHLFCYQYHTCFSLFISVLVVSKSDLNISG